jgi:transcriptional regulator with XRE-family HTH domain
MYSGSRDVVDRHAIAIVGRAVRIGRERAALSQRALAVRSEVSQTAISRLERGKVRGMGLVYFARVVRAQGDTMPLVGCPHGHDCDYARLWKFALQQVAVDVREDAPALSDEGVTLYELTRRAERSGDIDVLG